MKWIVLATLVALPAAAVAQTNTTGTLAPNTTATQTQPSATGGTTSTTPATTAAPGTTTPAASAAATAPARDAAIIVCGQEFSTGVGRLLVASASASSGVTAPSPGAPCAQALSDLFVAGFAVIDAQPINQQLQYTLVR